MVIEKLKCDNSGAPRRGAIDSPACPGPPDNAQPAPQHKTWQLQPTSDKTDKTSWPSWHYWGRGGPGQGPASSAVFMLSVVMNLCPGNNRVDRYAATCAINRIRAPPGCIGQPLPHNFRIIIAQLLHRRDNYAEVMQKLRAS